MSPGQGYKRGAVLTSLECAGYDRIIFSIVKDNLSENERRVKGGIVDLKHCSGALYFSRSPASSVIRGRATHYSEKSAP